MSLRANAAHCFRSMLTLISPELNTRVSYRIKFGKKLDLLNPVTLNEKILWLKFNTYWNNSLVKQCADKYRVREYVKSIGCEEILTQLYGSFETIHEVDWHHLPNSFVLKLNVGCGKNLIVPDVSKIDIAKAKNQVRKWFKNNAWLGYSEMQYKDVPMVLLMEEYLSSGTGEPPVDYKFYCMNGKAKYVMLCVGRTSNSHPKFFYYNHDWELMPFTHDALDNPDFALEKPDGIEKAFEYAERLSKPFPFVRTDLYLVNGQVFFGELTFTPSAGLDNGRLPETDRILGNELSLPISSSSSGNESKIGEKTKQLH